MRMRGSPSGQLVHEVIAEAFECHRQTVQRVLFGDTDVLEGESWEDHGIEVRGSASIKTRKASVAEVVVGQPNRCS